MEKRSLVFKLADRKSGEAVSIIEGGTGDLQGWDGMGNSLSRSKTL